ncbi:DUF6907 domain-containing protein [Streptomyces sp. NPDC004111]|uniref:DUF6907 domain-containing protein n=1 Tax=Streptomyces sp. NPDC004111 TaxID=3364690 RepID=UPI0036A452B4
MSAPTTVTVQTADCGPVTIPEPYWCTGAHEAEAYRVDIEHQGEQLRATVPTACHGEVTALSMSLVQRPFSTTETRVMAAVQLDGEWHEFDGPALWALSQALVRFAVNDMPQLSVRVDELNRDAR